ncbi:hypothetical protein OQA88_47 [Cercophora sp. LCS_1]
MATLMEDGIEQEKPQTNTNPKTLRLTENKRRYRARRKEYISDLEARLVEAREQGVQATKEVQLAARQVVAENERLRELLRLSGFSDTDIDAWQVTRCEDDQRQLEVKEKAKRCAAALGVSQGHNAPEGDWLTPPSETFGEHGLGKSPSHSGAYNTLRSCRGTECRANSPRSSQDALSTVISVANLTTIDRVASSSPTTHDSPPLCLNDKQAIPPCKLLTRLAEDPSTDLTQIPTIASAPHEEATPHINQGVSSAAKHTTCSYSTQPPKKRWTRLPER